MTMTAPTVIDPGVLEELVAIVGRQQVLAGPADRAAYAADTYRTLAEPLAAVLPGSPAEVAAVMAAAARRGLYVVPKGGGASYTDAYLHLVPGGITMDLRRLDRILAVSTEDMYVTVECGCTWARLNKTLEPLGLRTPFWGPASGLHATVGGSLSQNAAFFGTGTWGTAVEQALGIDVVLADGRTLHLGSHGKKAGKPVLRHYGPDLMGPFLADAGALGVKTTATLRVIRRPAQRGHYAYAFQDRKLLMECMSELSREGLGTEILGMDAIQQEARIIGSPTSLLRDLRTVAGVVRAGGLADGLSVMAAGRSYLKDVRFGLHASVEAWSAAELSQRLSAARKVARRFGGQPLPGSVTRVMHAEPFVPLDVLLAPDGRRWVPTHCIVGHSEAPDMHDAIMALLEPHRRRMQELNIDTSLLLMTIGNHGMLLEPMFFWPDAHMPRFAELARPEWLQKAPSHAGNPEARACVQELRAALVKLFADRGAVSMQLGKAHPYRFALQESSRMFLDQFRQMVDPAGILNPGALGPLPGGQ